ncbi:MAG: cytochrome c biogenesis protein ResB [Chloroflexi bacterium]|nr:cytochrome c biogenesis protein ResB [Chloroflexota bacterium]
MSESAKASTTTSSQTDPFDALWRFFSSTRLALILILVIAFTSFLGSLAPQAPERAMADAVSYARWVDTIRPKYGPLTDLFSAVGLFNVYSVFWFKILLVGLVFNTVICTVNRLPSLLQSIRTPKIKMDEAMFKNAKYRASFKPKSAGGKSSGGTMESLVQVLSKRHYKVSVEEEGDNKYLFADRYSVFKLGTLVTHTSIVVLLVGTVMGGMFGFVDDGVVIPEGKAYKVGFGESFSVRADKFAADYYEDGRPKDYYSDLTVIDGGKEVVKQRIRVNEPLEYKGVRFHQSFYGPVAALDVKADGGSVVYSDDLALSNSSETSSVGFTPLPGTDLFLVASLSGGGSNQLGVQLYRGDSPIARGAISPGQSQNVGGYDVSFKGVKQFTGLRVVKDPGVPIVWLASAMLVLGVCLTLYFPRRRIWARVNSREAVLSGTADRMVNLQEELNRLVEEVRAQEPQVVEANRKRGG